MYFTVRMQDTPASSYNAMADAETSCQLLVLDLPQLYKKPSAASLLSILSRLTTDPASWNGNRANKEPSISEDGIPAYLTRIISNSLAWIDSAEEKEAIWEAASQRLSERSGRMAMTSMSRVFSIPFLGPNGQEDSINIHLNEPSLTDDNVGHKTWVGSYILAKRLPYILPKHFPSLDQPHFFNPQPLISLPILPPPDSTSAPPTTSTPNPPLHTPPELSSPQPTLTPPTPPSPLTPPLRILELGAGTGLSGLAACALYPHSTLTHLTDLPAILPNTLANIHTNTPLYASRPPTAFALDWNALPRSVAPHDKYDIILAADSLYAPEHPGWLGDAICLFAKRQPGARVVTVLPYRDMDLPYHDLLRLELGERGFVVLEEGEESGFDDWGWPGQREEVLCWWCVWGWGDWVGREGGDAGKGGMAEEMRRREAVWVEAGGGVPEVLEVW